MANVQGVKEPWAVITDEEPSLQTLWQYGLRFRVEELFLDSKSGAFQLEESRIRDRQSLERLYLVVAIALLFATAHGMTEGHILIKAMLCSIRLVGKINS